MLESKKGQSLGAKGRHHRLRSSVVDRRGERGPLADAIESARGGRGVGLLVYGEPGVGETDARITRSKCTRRSVASGAITWPLHALERHRGAP